MRSQLKVWDQWLMEHVLVVVGGVPQCRAVVLLKIRLLQALGTRYTWSPYQATVNPG